MKRMVRNLNFIGKFGLDTFFNINFTNVILPDNNVDMNNTTLNQYIKINKFPVNCDNHYTLNHEKNPWIYELLDDLQSEIEEISSLSKDYKLKIDLSINKKKDPNLGEVLVIHSKVEGNYYTNCVRCLGPTLKPIDFSFKSCILHPSYQSKSDYQDHSELLFSGEEMELYFYDEKGIFDLKELIHEHIQLHIGHFPLHSENCQGLCPICGHNLNDGKCKHTI